jgi:hypothetical protein
MARESYHHFPLTLMEVSSTYQDRASLSSSLGAQLICHEWGKARLRVPDCLMRELEAALQEQLGQIAQAQRVPQPPQHDEQDNIGGICQGVEGGLRYAH